jgi:hypothetical protein
MGDHDKEREATLQEIARKTVLYERPGMDAVRVRRDISYRTTAAGGLLMDIYYPAAATPGVRHSVIAIALAYPDPQSRIRHFGPVTSWARLIAASGIAAVVYGTSAPADDIHAVLRHLRSSASSLAIDESRVGVFAVSANVTVALSAMMRDTSLKCAALLCGYTMNLDASALEAAAAYGFVDACAGKSVDDLPGDIPLFLVRAGREQNAGLNDALDRFVAEALARNLPVTLVNHHTGSHGFEMDDDSATSREIVKQMLAFLQFHLRGVPRA